MRGDERREGALSLDLAHINRSSRSRWWCIQVVLTVTLSLEI